jgi:hypothetical protein
MGFLPVLTLLFVIAKLAGYIVWSWWLVFSPMLLVAAVVTGLGCLALLAAILGDTD